MPDESDPPSNWKQATEALGPLCPYCGADQRSIDRDGKDWVCGCCSRRWPALSVPDKRFLRSLRIGPEE